MSVEFQTVAASAPELVKQAAKLAWVCKAGSQDPKTLRENAELARLAWSELSDYAHLLGCGEAAWHATSMASTFSQMKYEVCDKYELDCGACARCHEREVNEEWAQDIGGY